MSDDMWEELRITMRADPEIARRLATAHHPDRAGRCQGCNHGGNRPRAQGCTLGWVARQVLTELGGG